MLNSISFIKHLRVSKSDKSKNIKFLLNVEGDSQSFDLKNKNKNLEKINMSFRFSNSENNNSTISLFFIVMFKIYVF